MYEITIDISIIKYGQILMIKYNPFQIQILN